MPNQPGSRAAATHVRGRASDWAARAGRYVRLTRGGTAWQRRARLVVGAFVLVFGVVLFFAVGERQRPAPPPPVTRADPSAVVESQSAKVIQVQGARQKFKVEAQRQLTYADGSMKLEVVLVSVDQRAGRSFVVTGAEARVGKDQSHVTLQGDVRLSASDGLVVAADRASYSDSEGMVRVPGPLSFSRGRVSGSGVGATYDRDRDMLWLLDRARLTVAGDGRGSGRQDMRAGAAGFARREHVVRLERNVRIARPGQRVSADQATVFLSEDERRADAVELRGNAAVAGAAAKSLVRALRARDIDLKYAEDGETLQRAALAGGAVIQLAGSGRGGDRRVAGESLEMILTPDGSRVMTMTGRDGVQLQTPADGSTPARRIRAASLDGAGLPDRGLTAARLSGSVEYREALPSAKGARAAERLIRADTLDLVLGGGLAEIEEARFSGQVTIRDGDLRGESHAVLYRVKSGTMELNGGEPPAGQPPRVSDDHMTVSAARLELALDRRTLIGDGGVRSSFQSAAQPAGSGARADAVPEKPANRMPGILRAGHPVSVTAERLEYDGSAGRAAYSGGVRLWQGENAIQADTIALDQRTGNLAATGSARALLVLDQADAETEEQRRTATIAAASSLDYDDDAGRVTYSGGAHVSGPEGDLTATKVELHLTERRDATVRLEAYEQVTLRSGGREATGDRLTYFAVDGRYIVTGAPVRIVEDGRETTGRTLTLFRSTDRIVVDGKEETRTQTKSVKPPERFE